MIGASDGIAFLIGVAVGAAGQYLADKYTDRRRTQDESRNLARRFRDVSREIPKLIAEIGFHSRTSVTIVSSTATVHPDSDPAMSPIDMGRE